MLLYQVHRQKKGNLENPEIEADPELAFTITAGDIFEIMTDSTGIVLKGGETAELKMAVMEEIQRQEIVVPVYGNYQENDYSVAGTKPAVETAALENAELSTEDTEWNENAIFSAYTNDTRKVAAYDIKAALDVENNLDGSSIWCFSDIFEEFHMFPQEFHGGFGMLTINGIPKPGFYAMKMPISGNVISF